MADPERLLRARRLLRVYDVRPRDPLTGARPSAAEYKAEASAPLCVRCGREHVKVYEVECDDSKAYTVGSGCVAKTFGGWEPGKEEITRARSAEAKARKAADEAARKAWVEAAVQRVLGVCPVAPPAPPVTIGTPPFPVWNGDAEIATMGDTSRDPFAGGVFDYLRRTPGFDQSEAQWRAERQRILENLRSKWMTHAARQCMEQAGPGRSPTGGKIQGWDDPALVGWSIPQQVAYAVRQAWGRRK